MEHELKAIVAAESVPADLTITYDDLHGLWGGTIVTVTGDGRVERQTRERGSAQAEVVRKEIDDGELLELVRLLVELQAWEQYVAEAQPVPDESRAHLTISVGGNRSVVWERFNELQANDRLIRIKARMENL